MKYLEELLIGDCYMISNQAYIITTDHKKNGSRLAVSLVDGSMHWVKPDAIVDHIDIFTVDKDNNIVAIKERKKDVGNSSQNLS